MSVDENCEERGERMMEQKEKLIGLLIEADMQLEYPCEEECERCDFHDVGRCDMVHMADYLMENGVVVLKDESAPPCRACNHGWGSASADGIKTCEESCLELREYAKRKGGDK